jgi:hypothetical protein
LIMRAAIDGGAEAINRAVFRKPVRTAIIAKNVKKPGRKEERGRSGGSPLYSSSLLSFPSFLQNCGTSFDTISYCFIGSR